MVEPGMNQGGGAFIKPLEASATTGSGGLPGIACERIIPSGASQINVITNMHIDIFKYLDFCACLYLILLE